MKALIFLFLSVLSAVAQTNVIDLKHRPAQFTDLKGRPYNVELVRATLDGVIYSTRDGGGLIAYTNLSPDMLVAWGIPTNRILISALRADQRTTAMSRYREWAAQNQAAQTVQTREALAQQEFEKRRLAAESQIKQVQAGLAALRTQIEQEKVQRDQAWNRWVYTYSGYSYYSSSGGGTVLDNDYTRQVAARELARKVETDQAQVPLIEAELQRLRDAYEKEFGVAAP